MRLQIEFYTSQVHDRQGLMVHQLELMGAVWAQLYKKTSSFFNEKVLRFLNYNTILDQALLTLQDL